MTEIVKMLRNRLELKDDLLMDFQREIELANRADFGAIVEA